MAIGVYDPQYVVSIHAPREGCDVKLSIVWGVVEEFQFTHPGRGATIILQTTCIAHMFQFTHPGRGATYQQRA